MGPLLTASLIVRNEAAYLGDCLRALGRIADDVVVVDTGSTDETREIAVAHGAKLYEVPWQDDFAAARNESLARCLGEWILYIDADERVRPTSRDDLRRILQIASQLLECVAEALEHGIHHGGVDRLLGSEVVVERSRRPARAALACGASTGRAGVPARGDPRPLGRFRILGLFPQ